MLTIDYHAAYNQNVLTSIWMKERMSLLPDICVKTVMVLTHQMRTRLFYPLQKRVDLEVCQYRFSAGTCYWR